MGCGPHLSIQGFTAVASTPQAGKFKLQGLDPSDSTQIQPQASSPKPPRPKLGSGFRGLGFIRFRGLGFRV